MYILEFLTDFPSIQLNDLTVHVYHEPGIQIPIFKLHNELNVGASIALSETAT